MKQRKARKKTLPTRKKEMLFPPEMRGEALRQAVDSLEKFKDYLRELTAIAERMQIVCVERDGWNDVKCRVDGNDPTLIHFTGVPEDPVGRIMVDCTVSKQGG